MKSLHPRNIHNHEYDFELLQQKCPDLQKYILESYGKKTIDFSNAEAVKTLNKSLLMAYYGIHYWEFPDTNLCPPIPGRVDYIHHIANLIGNTAQAHVLDIGTGATCIYPILGNAVYNWTFVGTDIDSKSIASAQKIVNENSLEKQIHFRKQTNKEHILQGILKKEDAFSVTMCNPPFYASEAEARGANNRKSKNLGTTAVRNFAGNANELWYKGGEKAFLHTYLYESSLTPKASSWFTSLVSKKENCKSLEASAKKLGVKKFKIIPMHQGNKVTRIVCWAW